MDDKYYAQRQEIALKKWESATIQNNFIFSKTMEMNPKLCKELIECILNREIENITYPEREKVIENRIDSKGVRLDVYAKDDKENIFDLEMQVYSGGDDLAKRTRYYQGAIDGDNLKHGKHYTSLKDSYIIFICPFDPFNLKRWAYTFHERCDEENSLLLKTGTAKIFLNAKGKIGDITENLKNFLDYVENGVINNRFTEELNNAVKSIRTNEKARLDFMGYEMDLLLREMQGREKEREAMQAEMNEIISQKDGEIAMLKQQLAAAKAIVQSSGLSL